MTEDSKDPKDDQVSEILNFTNDQFIWRFSPNQTDPALLESILVGREALLTDVLEKIEEGIATTSRHHVLLFGPRGIGKTHFLSLLNHRILSNPKLKSGVQVAWLNEDETTTSLVQFLVRVYRTLISADPQEHSEQWLDDVLDHTPKEIERLLTARLAARFEKKLLVILVENLNMLLDNLKTEGQMALRSYFQENPFATIIATSQQLSKALTRREQPFFGFFQSIQLEALSLDDAQQLLLKIASTKRQVDLIAFLQSPEGRSRVRAIHHLAGGNHRVYIVLSNFITKESLNHLVGAFQKMADELTPYYQERLRWISAQQRQIVEILCRQRKTLTTKFIAKQLMAAENTISSQIRKLVELGYLAGTRRGRETYYELSEPLMRLAYEVKHQSLLVMLIDFLRVWYDAEQMQTLCHGDLSQTTIQYMEAAIARSQTHPDPRLAILDEEIELAKSTGRLDELARIWEEKATVTKNASDWIRTGYAFKRMGANAQAIQSFEKAISIDGANANYWMIKGTFHQSIGQHEDALQSFLKVAKMNEDDPFGWYQVGNAYQTLERLEDAMNSYNRSIGIDESFAPAWISCGWLNFLAGAQDEAIKCFDTAIQLAPQDYKIHFVRILSCWRGQRWESGFESLHTLLQDDLMNTDWAQKTTVLIGELMRSAKSSKERLSRFQTFADMYRQAEELGDSELIPNGQGHPVGWFHLGLVSSFIVEGQNEAGHAALQAYFETVKSALLALPDSELPLRLCETLVRYFESNDPAALADLIAPERELLEDALGLTKVK